MSEDELPPADLSKEQMVELLKTDVGKWSAWRVANPEIRVDLRGAELAGEDLRGANLSRADLSGARLRQGSLDRVDFSGADLSGADLSGADLIEACFRRADLGGANLNEADLRGATDLDLDSTRIRGAVFPAVPADNWSRLRSAYSGPRYALVLLLLLAFFAPYAAKTAGLVGASRAQESIAAAFGVSADPLVREIVTSLRDQLPRQQRVWEVLLGKDNGVRFFGTTLLFLFYNVLRALLTGVVNPMRDAEERSGMSPRREVWANGERTRRLVFKSWVRGGWSESYGWLILPHKIVTVLGYAAVASFAYHAYTWLLAPVWLLS